MSTFAVPDYVSDPPIVWPHFDRESVARRWLKDIEGERPGFGPSTFAPLDATHALAARLDTSKEHIVSILHEAATQHQLKQMLAEVFRPVPNEGEAREQYVRLLRKTRDLPCRSARTVWIHPEYVNEDQ